MKLGIPQVNNGGGKFAKVVKQSEPVESGMYKAVFQRFITLGFHEDTYNEGKVKFYVTFGFEAIEDMMGNKIPHFKKEFDDGTEQTGPTMFFRDYPIADSLHHKSGGFAVAKALDPNVATVSRGKDNEHTYIDNFNWDENLGKSVLLQIEKKKSKNGNFYNRITNVMPLGAPLDVETDPILFNLYNPEHKEVFDSLDFFTKKRIKESLEIGGEPEVIYRETGNDEEQGEQEQEEKENKEPPVDFDDDVPF